MRSDEEFAPLRIVKKNLAGFDRSVYRVYKSPTEFITVEAATALEAFRESGIKNPYRIMRETRFMERLVDQTKFSDKEELVETGTALENSLTIREETVSPTQQTSAMPHTPQEQTVIAEIAEEASALSEQEIQELLGKEAQKDAVDADTLSAEEIDGLLKEEE